MVELLMLRGLPASGKTTYAKSLKDYTRVNKDDLRSMLHDGVYSKKNEDLVLRVRDLIIKESLARGVSVVVDDTNFNPHHWNTLHQIAISFNVGFSIKEMDTTLEECLERDAKRFNPVGEKVITEMYEKYRKEEKVQPQINPNLPQAIICDIDGTLAHMDKRSPFDWHRVGEDVLDEKVNELLKLYEANGYTIILMSGRDGVCLDETSEWLAKNRVPYDLLLMRPKGNNEKDYIVKERMYNESVKDRYQVKFVLDDRDQVVKLWRSLGLTCFQVAEGNF